MNRRLTEADDDAIEVDLAIKATLSYKRLLRKYGVIDKKSLQRAAERSRQRKAKGTK